MNIDLKRVPFSAALTYLSVCDVEFTYTASLNHRALLKGEGFI